MKSWVYMLKTLNCEYLLALVLIIVMLVSMAITVQMADPSLASQP